MSVRIAAAWLLAVVLVVAGAPAVAQDTDFAGVYAVRRVITSSTCASGAVGDVSTAIWMIEWSASGGFTMNALGATRFRSFNGTMSGDAITLTGQGEADAIMNTMTVTLTRGRRGALSGTETVAVTTTGGPCSIVRSVTAHSLN